MTSQSRKDIIVLGLGNPLMSDEGIGGFLVETLAQKADQFPNVEFLDAGCGGLALLYPLEQRKKAIIIDCALMDEQPGTIRRFTPDDVKSVKSLSHYSLHEVDILNVLKMAKKLGQCPDQVIIFGIQPEKIELDQNLTPALQQHLDEYISLIEKDLHN